MPLVVEKHTFDMCMCRPHVEGTDIDGLSHKLPIPADILMEVKDLVICRYRQSLVPLFHYFLSLKYLIFLLLVLGVISNASKLLLKYNNPHF